MKLQCEFSWWLKMRIYVSNWNRMRKCRIWAFDIENWRQQWSWVKFEQTTKTNRYKIFKFERFNCNKIIATTFAKWKNTQRTRKFMIEMWSILSDSIFVETSMLLSFNWLRTLIKTQTWQMNKLKILKIFKRKLFLSFQHFFTTFVYILRVHHIKTCKIFVSTRSMMHACKVFVQTRTTYAYEIFVHTFSTMYVFVTFSTIAKLQYKLF